MGVRAVLEARDKKIDFESQPSMEEVQSIHIVKHEVVYDIDYYTLANVSTGQLNVTEWIDQAYHMVKRDSRFFFGDI